MPRPGALAICALTIAVWSTAFAVDPPDHALAITAAVQASPPQIRLAWRNDSQGGGYAIHRKLPAELAWTSLATLAQGTTSWTDSTVAAGTIYEYAVRHGSYANDYIAAGIEVPVVDARGAVVLLVDAAQAAALSGELARLVDDLRGDGWKVLRHDVPAGSTPPQVKALILSDYQAAPAEVRQVLIIGRIAVPYSGQFAPDGHGEHVGAWPADTYYADMVGTWTDMTVNTTAPSRSQNDNVPGDGKFDQSTIPASASAFLGVGRVDFANMWKFPDSTTTMLRRYLDRDHAWRTGQIVVQQKALIDDNFYEFSGEAFSQNGWRLASLVGSGNVLFQDWFGTLQTNSYLFAYGCGAGTYESANGVGYTADFVGKPSNAVFTMLFGSYFGDWDAENVLLRAPLAGAGLGLTCCWAGRPNVFVHRMGMGATIGETMACQFSTGFYTPTNSGARMVHQALMGDPTLRLHPMLPPTGLDAAIGQTSVVLQWTASPDATLGYHIYRAAASGDFARLTAAPITATTFCDSGLVPGAYTYQVRAIRLQATPSGSYINNSVGAMVGAAVVGTTVPQMTVCRGALAIPDGGSDRLAGTVVSITYTIANAGTAPLSLGAVALSGASSHQITVTGQPQTPVAPGGSTALVLAVSPALTGLGSFDIAIPSDDPVRGSYAWQVAITPEGGGGADPIHSAGGNGGCGAGGMAMLLAALALIMRLVRPRGR